MADIVNCAKQYLGVRYVFGGTSPNGFDCSGLVQYVYRQARGINLSRTTATQINEGRSVERNDLQLIDEHQLEAKNYDEVPTLDKILENIMNDYIQAYSKDSTLAENRDNKNGIARKIVCYT